jgi:hypothetical protein
MSIESSTSSQVDPRGLRFAAALTSAVLALVILTQSAGLLALQTLVFAAGAFLGLRRSPYSMLFGVLKRAAKLGPPVELEAETPPRFAQAVGLVFGVNGTAGFAAGSPPVGTTATAFALAAAFMNAAFGFCLGCEIYLVIARITSRTTVEGSSS